MLLIVGSIRLSPARISEALPAMARMIEASRAEDGCDEYSYAADLLDAALIRVTERWRDQPSLDRHFASAHLAEWRSAWPRLGIHDRNLTVFEVFAARPA